MKSLEALRALGTGGEAPVEAKQRVQAALIASLAAAAAASGIGAGVRTVTLPPAPAPLLSGLTSAKAFAIAGGIWLAGGVTGAMLYRALQTQEVRVVYVDRPIIATNSTAPTPTAPTMSSALTAPTPSGSSAEAGLKPAVTALTQRGSSLARERALLDLARASAARGEPVLALQRTERHRAQFPRGKLSEERQALAIRALLSLGRADEARARASEFHLAYPNSLLAPAIDAALSVQ